MIKVHVGGDPYGIGLGIFIINEISNTHKQILRLNGSEYSQFWEDFDPVTVSEPTFKVDGDIGPLLLQALVQHYHGADDTRALRKDYDHEKQRVDKLMDTIAEIAKGA